MIKISERTIHPKTYMPTTLYIARTTFLWHFGLLTKHLPKICFHVPFPSAKETLTQTPALSRNVFKPSGYGYGYLEFELGVEI